VIHRETGKFEWYSDAANTLRFQDTPGGALALPEIFYPNSLGNIAGGFQTTAFPAINIQNYIGYLNDTYNGPVRVPEPQNVYNIQEKIWAGYAQANFKMDNVRGNIGVRVVNTKQDGTSTDRITYENEYCVNGPGGPFDPNKPVGADGNCTVIPEAQRQLRVFQPQFGEQELHGLPAELQHLVGGDAEPAAACGSVEGHRAAGLWRSGGLARSDVQLGCVRLRSCGVRRAAGLVRRWRELRPEAVQRLAI
jgi:hypothetical protein